MIFMGYKIYQLMLFFGIYSIIGYLIEQVLYGFSGYAVKRGFLSGPAGIIYGIGGLIVGVLPAMNAMTFSVQILFMILIAIVLNTAMVLLVRFISGAFLWKFSIAYPAVGAACGIIILYGGHSLIQNLVFKLPTWLDMVILLLIFVPMVIQFIDSVSNLFTYRGDIKRLESYRTPVTAAGAEGGNGARCIAESANAVICDHKGYAEAVMTTLFPYRRWLRAYPAFRKATVSKIFRGCSTLEKIDIKKYM